MIIFVAFTIYFIFIIAIIYYWIRGAWYMFAHSWLNKCCVLSIMDSAGPILCALQNPTYWQFPHEMAHGACASLNWQPLQPRNKVPRVPSAWVNNVVDTYLSDALSWVEMGKKTQHYPKMKLNFGPSDSYTLTCSMLHILYIISHWT